MKQSMTGKAIVSMAIGLMLALPRQPPRWVGA